MQLAPSVVGFLGILEDVVDVLALAEKVVEIFRMSLVGQLQLVLEIVETVVPVHSLQVHAVGLSLVSRQVGVEEHVIVETVGGYRVVGIVGLVGNPVLVQFLRAKHQYRLVAQFVILDDSQGSKSLAETHGVGKDATMVFLQLVDASQCRISLKVKKFLPDDAVLESYALIGEHILGDVFQELVEDMVERDEVDVLGRILLIHGLHVFEHTVGDIGELASVCPKFIEGSEIVVGHRRRETGDGGEHAVAFGQSEVCGREVVERIIAEVARITSFLSDISQGGIFDVKHTWYQFIGNVGLEVRLAVYFIFFLIFSSSVIAFSPASSPRCIISATFFSLKLAAEKPLRSGLM